MSAADPRHTLLNLVGAAELPPEFVWATQSIKLRGSVAKVHLLTDGRHGLPAGTLAVAPSLKYLERAFDAAKYGDISAQPYLEVTTSGNTVSIHFQFAPYALRKSDWANERATLERLAVDALAQFPGLARLGARPQSVTPLDIEPDYGMSEGDLNHGQLILDQIFFMRPLPGWSNHRTPVDGLWLCGSGVHGGGGISGASGRNAARRVLSSQPARGLTWPATGPDALSRRWAVAAAATRRTPALRQARSPRHSPQERLPTEADEREHGVHAAEHAEHQHVTRRRPPAARARPARSRRTGTAAGSPP